MIGAVPNAIIASPGMTGLKWLQPVRRGDAIRTSIEVAEVRPLEHETRPRPDRDAAHGLQPERRSGSDSGLRASRATAASGTATRSVRRVISPPIGCCVDSQPAVGRCLAAESRLSRLARSCDRSPVESLHHLPRRAEAHRRDALTRNDHLLGSHRQPFAERRRLRRCRCWGGRRGHGWLLGRRGRVLLAADCREPAQKGEGQERAPLGPHCRNLRNAGHFRSSFRVCHTRRG